MPKHTQPEPGQSRAAQLEALGRLDEAHKIRERAHFRRLTAADFNAILAHARAIVAALDAKETSDGA